MEIAQPPAKKSAKKTVTEKSTATTPPGASLQPAKSTGSKAWIWILVVVVILLIVGGIIVALMLAGTVNKAVNKAVSDGTDSATTNVANEIANKATTAEGSASEEQYAEGAVAVLEKITNALGKYEAAATAGSEGDFDASTAALKDGIEEIAKAETAFDKLTPPEGLEQIHDLLKQAVEKTREGLELGIEGNETEEIDKIEESAGVLQQVADLLERISQEIDRLTEE